MEIHPGKREPSGGDVADLAEHTLRNGKKTNLAFPGKREMEDVEMSCWRSKGGGVWGASRLRGYRKRVT